MCEICGQYFCYPSCPSFVGNSAELGASIFRCSVCSSRIFESDDYTVYNGKVVCENCDALVGEERKGR